MRIPALSPSPVQVVRRLVAFGSAAWPILGAIALGIAVLFAAGFADPHAIHEAAHDARHTLNFPCH
jgi:cobalt transporter subunit CbtB